MIELGYTLSSEEFRPRDLVGFAAKAEAAGFSYASISDHFHPWTDQQGQSPFVWAVIGGVAMATDRLRLGTGVTCPTMRIHPAIVAQAAATAADMLPAGFFLGVGTGENLNEHIVGHRWPPHSVRLEMLKEAVSIMRELWNGDYTTREGKYFVIDNARLYTLPKTPPPIYMAASGMDAAKTAGEIGDGLISTRADKKLVETFEKSGGQNKPKYVQIHVCYAADEKAARKTALEQWPIAATPGSLHAALSTPAEMMDSAAMVTEDDVAEVVVCGPDPQRHKDKIRECVEAGYDHVYVHQVGPEQEQCIDFYAREIFPELQKLAA
jgi:G6PDH family F420-dependent oxidoreductase